MACHSRLPRLSEQGRHEEVVARAGQARILPRGKAARAWARSLVALGRADEARAVLLRDFRKHAELPSLVALADLEASEGRSGLAAAHYARAASLETDPLAGRRDVCELFRRRAERFFAEGEALAADLDLRRVATICPRGKTTADEVTWRDDRALHELVAAAANVQARAQRTLRGCEGDRCRPPSLDARTQALTQALAQARAAGPAALREAAARLRVQLEVGDVAALLEAELRGELGLDLVDLDELRGWIGEASAVDVVAAADARLSPLARDYVRLRLAQLGPGYELPGDDAARSTASTVIRLLDAADEDPGAAAMAWRVFVLLGDLPSAEMALAASLSGRGGRARAAAIDEPAREAAGKAAGKASVDAGRKDRSAGDRAGGKMSQGTGAPAAARSSRASGETPAGARPGGTAGGQEVSAGTGARGGEMSVGTGSGGAAGSKVSAGTGARGGEMSVGTGSGGAAGIKVSAGTGARGGEMSAGTGSGGAAGSKMSAGSGESGRPKLSGAGAAEPGEEARDGAPAQRLVPPPGLWSARVAVDAATLPRLLQLARLRGVAGRRDQALAIAAWALAEGQARGVPAIAETAASEARHELAAGRPWAALALASVVRGGPTEDVVRAAGSALVLEQAACGERCGDADDRAAVRHVLGETWLLDQEKRATESAFARAAAAPRGHACPLLAESLAPGAGGPLAATLRRARTEGLQAPGLGEELRRAIESDLTLDCAGRVAVPLLYAADARVAAQALSDSLAHVPQEIAAGQLALQSELALVLGRRDHADQLALAAAAASAGPREVWRRAARMAAWIDARHYELLALRQQLLHGAEGPEAEEVRLRLVVRGLRDADDAWAPRNAAAGREALIRGVESYFAELPPARRWHAREELALALAEYSWADETAAALVREAVWPELSLVLAHPAAFRRLERALGEDVLGLAAPALAPAQLAAERAPITPLGGPGSGAPGSEGRAKTTGLMGQGGKDRVDGAGPATGEMMFDGTGPSRRPGATGVVAVALPAEAEAFCSVDSLRRARLAALGGLTGEAKLRAAAALAVTGDEATRVRALQALVAGLEPARRGAVLDAVIAGLAAAPGREAATMVVGDDALLAVVFGLVRDPARRPREIKGQDG